MKSKITFPENQLIGLISKMHLWLGLGLFTTGFTAFKLSQSFGFLQIIANNNLIILLIALIQLVLVIWLSTIFDKIPRQMLRFYFIGFAIFNGISLPLIFQFFTQNYLQSTFFILAIMFIIQ